MWIIDWHESFLVAWAWSKSSCMGNGAKFNPRQLNAFNVCLLLATAFCNCFPTVYLISMIISVKIS